jgi:hypothetical protein
MTAFPYILIFFKYQILYLQTCPFLYIMFVVLAESIYWSGGLNIWGESFIEG